MKNFLRPHNNAARPGQTLVLFALMSILMLTGLGLIIDGGFLYSKRRTMQNAADIAALRGTRVIAQESAGSLDNNDVWAEILAAATANGVADGDDVECDYINNVYNNIGTCKDNPGTVPSGVTGVIVQVREEHTPFFMRVLGITTTGTAATATAQVRAVTEMTPTDVPFMVCGIDTALAGGGTYDILATTSNTDPGLAPDYIPVDYKTLNSPPTINSGAYSYDWNSRDSNGNFTLISGAPQFVIYGSGISKCGITADWKGLLEQETGDSVRLRLETSGSTTRILDIMTGDYGPSTTQPWPLRSLSSTMGCRANSVPSGTGCIMLLPIVHYRMPACPTLCSGNTTDIISTATFLRGRLWGVFLVEPGGSNEFYGRLIKNYPIQTDGDTTWSPGYLGPITVTLVQGT